MNLIKRNSKKTEDDFKDCATYTFDVYRTQLTETNAFRKQYYSLHLPQFVKVILVYLGY